MAKKYTPPKHTDLAEFLADLAARRPYALAVSAAVCANDKVACEAAQKAFRAAFPQD